MTWLVFVSQSSSVRRKEVFVVAVHAIGGRVIAMWGEQALIVGFVWWYGWGSHRVALKIG